MTTTITSDACSRVIACLLEILMSGARLGADISVDSDYHAREYWLTKLDRRLADFSLLRGLLYEMTCDEMAGGYLSKLWSFLGA